MQRERERKEGKNRKQCFKAQPIWLVFALLSQECEFMLPMCLQRETGIEKGSVSNCLLETTGKSGSQNVWESHQASSVRAQLPGIAAWGQ